MISENKKKYVDVETVMEDFDISRAKAYSLIHDLNRSLKTQYPNAIVIAGKANRRWYDQACLVPVYEEGRDAKA